MKVDVLYLLFALLLLDLTHGAAIRRIGHGIRNKQIQYLQKFGYLDAVHGDSNDIAINSRVGDSEFSDAIRLFQQNFGIPQTGLVDAETIREMNKPRCGVPDFPADGNSGPMGYTITGLKWNVSNLSYRIMNFTSKLPPSTQANVIKEAFKMWSDVTPLTFTRTESSRANIKIGFERGEHGDGYAFDGLGNGFRNTLAHAFYPPNGVMHFDDDEPWTLEVNRGIDLLQVAVHEIGHAIGLRHSKEKLAIMYATYQSGLQTVALHDDDIAGIRQMYPRKRDAPATPRPADPNPPVDRRTYACPHRNPCTQESRDRGEYYFPHDNRNMFIQCNIDGRCHNMDCRVGTVWNPAIYTCDWPPRVAL